MSPKLNAEGFLARLWAMDDLVVQAGFHATSPWWRKEAERLVSVLAQGGPDATVRLRRWIIRAGRRAGKSSFLCRFAVAWAKWGPWFVPAGDTPVIAFLSVSMNEAGARLRTIGEILTAIGEPFERRGDEIELTGSKRLLFKVFACNTHAVGFTSVLIIGDEVARWENREHTANPAALTVGSLMPALATQAYGFAILCSSAWSTDDYHAECFDAGNTDHQIVSEATTWEANPTLTEIDCRALEPDEATFSREYANQPQPGLSLALNQEHIKDAIRPAPTGEQGRAVLILDPSSGRGDGFASGVARWVRAGELWELVISDLDAIAGKFYGIRSADSIVAELAHKAKRAGATQVISDQREEMALSAAFMRHGLKYTSIPWTASSKPPAVDRLRRLLADRQIVLPDDVALRKELASFQQKLMPSGYVTYAARANGHDDRVAILLTAVMADLEGLIDKSPVRRGNRLFAAFMESKREKTPEEKWKEFDRPTIWHDAYTADDFK